MAIVFPYIPLNYSKSTRSQLAVKDLSWLGSHVLFYPGLGASKKHGVASKLLGLLQLFLDTLKGCFFLAILEGDFLYGRGVLFVLRVLVVENQFPHVKQTNGL